MTSKDTRTAAEALRARLDVISELVEEHLPAPEVEARLRRLKDEAKDHRRGESISFHGRRSLLDALLSLAQKPQQGPMVLAGPGGAGKTTLAMALAECVRAQGGQVWWISARDPVTLSQGLKAVAQQLDGTLSDVEAITRGRAGAADRFWRLLDRAFPGWLLVIDEADDPRSLAAANSPAGIQDLTGWVRSCQHGVAVVTSRETDPRMWAAARLMPVTGLEEHDAAQVLRELAPAAGNEDQARSLARRLEGHPLGLRLAGDYLCSRAARGITFAAYEEELRRAEPHPQVRPGVGSVRPSTARALQLSLDVLTQQGIPQARPLLQLASCYASAAIPKRLLDADLLAALPAGQDDAPQIRHLDEVLHGLREIGLIRQHEEGGMAIHPVLTEASRASLEEPPPYASWIRRTAIVLLAAAVDDLSPHLSEDWPHFLLLGPHLLSLLESTAQRVDSEHLGLLMETTARIAGVFNISGAGQAGSVLCERALLHSAALGDNHLAVLHVRHTLAWAIADRGDLAKAEALYRDVLRERLRLLGPSHRDVLRSHSEIAWIAGCRKDWAEAEKGYRTVLRDSAGVVQPDEPDLLITRHELGWAISNQGRYSEARKVFQAVLADRLRVLGPEHPRTLTTRHELAWITARGGNWAKAEADYRELLGLRLRILPEDHPDTLVIRHELAWIAAHQGRVAEAAAGYTDVLGRRHRVLGDDHPHTQTTRQALEELRHGRIVDACHLA